jgi:hypothetical protein
MQEMSDYRLILSEERMNTYINYSGEYKGFNSIELYKWNTALSESLYPALQTIEVALRNTIHNAIILHFNDINWLFNQDFLHKWEQITVKKEIENLIRKQKKPTVHGLISELKFGFWTSLLDKRYEQVLWTKIIKDVFPKLKRKYRTRKFVSKIFNQIRNLRNRVFHYEPIWYWHDLKKQHMQIIEAIQWIDRGALNLIENIDRFELIYKEGPKKI